MRIEPWSGWLALITDPNGDGDAYCEADGRDEGHSLLVYHGSDSFATLDAAFEVIIELSFDLQCTQDVSEPANCSRLMQTVRTVPRDDR